MKKFNLLMLAAILAISGAMALISCSDDDVNNSIVTDADSVVFEPYFSDDYECVDLGLGVKWATKNIGALKSTDFGYYFAWGEVAPKGEYNWRTYKYTIPGATSMTKYSFSSLGAIYDGKDILESNDDAASVILGKKWRMPNLYEMNDLVLKCSWTWCDNYENSGTAGYLVRSEVRGYTDKYIFLPAAGHVGGRYAYDTNTKGMYWTSSLISDTFGSLDAAQLYFQDDGWETCQYNRQIGMTIRPVQIDGDFVDVSTLSATNVTTKSAVLEGFIEGNGGHDVIARGFYFGETENMNKWAFCDSLPDVGGFSKEIKGLKEGTQYYYKAYAVNANGISYGDIMAFKIKKMPCFTSLTFSGSKPTNEPYEGYNNDPWKTGCWLHIDATASISNPDSVKIIEAGFIIHCAYGVYYGRNQHQEACTIKDNTISMSVDYFDKSAYGNDTQIRPYFVLEDGTVIYMGDYYGYYVTDHTDEKTIYPK